MTAMGDNLPLLTDSDVDSFAWDFLRSAYAGPSYLDWSLDRRVDTFLRRQGFSHVADDGDLSNIVVDRILDCAGTAPPTTASTPTAPSTHAPYGGLTKLQNCRN